MKKILFIALMFFQLLASAQVSRSLKGTVKDINKDPVIGAAVMLDGASGVGAVSDLNGNWQLNFTSKAGEKARLRVTCLGYVEQVIEIGDRAVLNIVLEEDSEELEDAVVVGYGSMRRSDLTGSVTSVRIDETEAGQSASLSSLLQGRAAGVQVTSNSASPDAGVSIQIRGASSFNSGSEPLYVVDGIIINASGESSVMSSNLGGDNAGGDEATNGLMGINPMDIASVEILKDASATAIYGSQGANGVILITTKTASRERPVITASVGVDVSTPYKKQPMMNFTEYGEYLRAMVESPLVQEYNPDMINTARGRLNIMRSDYFWNRYEPIDWQDYMMRTAVNQRYYVSVAGKPKNSNYLFSLGYNDTQGIIKTTGFKNLTVRLNMEHNLGKKALIGMRSGVSYLNSQLTQGASIGTLTAATSLMRSMLTTAPYSKILDYDDEGDVIDWGDDENQQYGPNRWMQGFVNNRVEYRINPSLYFQYKILPWMTFKTTAGCDYRVTEQSKFKSRLLTSNPTGSTAGVAHTDRLAWNWDTTLNFYKRLKNKHVLQGTLGMSMSQNQTVIQTTEGANIDQWKAKERSLNAAAYGYFTYTEASASLMSFFARGIYNYADRYVLTATFRADGSSRFSGRNKWGFFPSAAFAWRITKEPWFNVPAISMAKLRVGWGQVGNQNIASYATIYNYTTGYYPDHGNAAAQQTLTTTTSNLPNADLKWETTEQTNLGLDIGLFKGRLTLSVDAYYKLTRDLLQTKTLAPSSGMTNPWVNMGSIQNMGLEFTLDAVPVKIGDWEWSIGGNMSFNKNKILSINPDGIENDYIYLTPDDRRYVSYFNGDQIGSGNVMRTFLNIFIEGQPMSLFYGIPTDGLVQEGQMGVPYSESSTAYRGPGSVNYIDVNKDGYITELDRTIIGDPNPLFTYGFNTCLRWKGLSLSATFIGSYGNDLYNVNKMMDTNTTQAFANVTRDTFNKQWTPENTDTWYPSLGALNGDDVKWASDRYVEDGSYLRLSNLALSYDIPLRGKNNKNKNFFIRGINVTASGGNLFIWTKYSSWDPDVNSYGGIRRKGADMGSYPGARSFKFDVKFTF